MNFRMLRTLFHLGEAFFVPKDGLGPAFYIVIDDFLVFLGV